MWFLSCRNVGSQRGAQRGRLGILKSWVRCFIAARGRGGPLLFSSLSQPEKPVACQRCEEEKESRLPFLTVFPLHLNGEEFCLSNLTQWAWLCIASPLALCFRFCAAALQQPIEQRTERGVEPTRSRKRLDFCVKELCLHGALLACQVQPSSFISILSCYNRFISGLMAFDFSFSPRLLRSICGCFCHENSNSN